MKIRPIYIQARKIRAARFPSYLYSCRRQKTLPPGFFALQGRKWSFCLLDCVHAGVTASDDAVTKYSTLSIPIVVQASLNLHEMA